MFPVYSQSGNLGVEVREVSTLKQWIVAETYARYDVTSTERDLFNFREKVLHLAVEDKLPNLDQRNLFLRPDLGGIKNVEVEIIRIVPVFDDLNSEGPLRINPVFNGFV